MGRATGRRVMGRIGGTVRNLSRGGGPTSCRGTWLGCGAG